MCVFHGIEARACESLSFIFVLKIKKLNFIEDLLYDYDNRIEDYKDENES